MKIVFKNFEVGGPGSCKMTPQHPEDFWHLFNLLDVGDTVHAVTFRKIGKGDGAKKSNVQTRRVKIGVVVEDIDFDHEQCTVRVRGRNITENNWIPLGSFHTLELAQHRAFELQKDEWDHMHADRIKIASDPTHDADCAAVVMQPGVASVCLIGSHMTQRKEKIEINIPKKRMGSATRHNKGMIRFFNQVLQSIDKHIDFEVVKCCIIASPGFLKDEFFAYLSEECIRREMRNIIENKSKFLLIHSSSGHMHAIKQILEDPAVSSQLSDTKAASEVRVLNEFYDMLKVDESRALYGWNHIHAAQQRDAIQHLLLSDDLFRCAEYSQRKKYVEFVESVREMGGHIHIFSAMHPSGEQLSQLTGIAAILRFPVPDILEMTFSDDDEEDSSSS